MKICKQRGVYGGNIMVFFFLVFTLEILYHFYSLRVIYGSIKIDDT